MLEKQEKDNKAYQPLSLKEIGKKLLEQQAKAEVAYDQEFQIMKAHQRRLKQEQEVLVHKIDKLRPTAQAILDGSGAGLTRNAARAALKYRALHKRLYRMRAAIRIAYTRGVPIGSTSPLPVPKSPTAEE